MDTSAITQGAETKAYLKSKHSIKNISIMLAMVEAKLITKNVRTPAECLLLVRSQPRIAASVMDKNNLKNIEPIVICDDQVPLTAFRCHYVPN